MTEAEWLSSADPQAMLRLYASDEMPWPAGMPAPLVSGRKLRLFACGCTRLVWDKLTGPRSRRAVEVAERYADGEATEAELTAARGQGYGPTRDVAFPDARRAAEAVALSAGKGLASPATQAALLRCVFGNPHNLVTLPKWPCGKLRLSECPWLTWQGGTVRKLAEAAYESRRSVKCERCWKGLLEGGVKCSVCGGTGRIEDGLLDPVALAVLADAVEEAGCTEEAMLRHLRGWVVGFRRRNLGPYEHDEEPYWLRSDAPHARGCHVVDLLLDKG